MLIPDRKLSPDRFAAGMARQLERLREATADGMPRRGWKIGINVPEVLRSLGLPHPGVAWIDGRRVHASGSVLDAPPRASLRVEPEVAIRVARDVPAGCTPDAARDRIAEIHPALEIVDYAVPASGLDDAVASCMFHHATVLGAPASLDAAQGLGRRWPVLRVDGEASDPPRDDLVPEDLGALVAFTADLLAAFDQRLLAGDLVLSGSYVAKAAPLAPGHEVVAEHGPLGRVSARLESSGGRE